MKYKELLIKVPEETVKKLNIECIKYWEEHCGCDPNLLENFLVLVLAALGKDQSELTITETDERV